MLAALGQPNAGRQCAAFERLRSACTGGILDLLFVREWHHPKLSVTTSDRLVFAAVEDKPVAAFLRVRGRRQGDGKRKRKTKLPQDGSTLNNML